MPWFNNFSDKVIEGCHHNLLLECRAVNSDTSTSLLVFGLMSQFHCKVLLFFWHLFVKLLKLFLTIVFSHLLSLFSWFLLYSVWMSSMYCKYIIYAIHHGTFGVKNSCHMTIFKVSMERVLLFSLSFAQFLSSK